MDGEARTTALLVVIRESNGAVTGSRSGNFERPALNGSRLLAFGSQQECQGKTDEKCGSLQWDSKIEQSTNKQVRRKLTLSFRGQCIAQRSTTLLTEIGRI